MNDADVYRIMSNYLSVVFLHGAMRFIKTKKYNRLENTVDIETFADSIKLSDSCIVSKEIKSVEDIPFKFENELLIDAVLSLTEKEQNIIYRKYVLDMTDEEIANEMNVSRQSITSKKLARLNKLRVFLQEHRQLWRELYGQELDFNGNSRKS